jgi:hypothetical protein
LTYSADHTASILPLDFLYRNTSSLSFLFLLWVFSDQMIPFVPQTNPK